MKFCNQDTCISKTITARSYKLGQLIDMSRLPGEICFKMFYLDIVLCKFGQRKLDILKTIIARSFKLEQLIEDKE